MKKLNVGFVGVSAHALEHLIPAVHSQGELRVAAFASRNPERIAAKAEEYDATIFPDWQDLVKSNKVDAIVCAANPLFHETVLELSLKARKPIFVEKPCATDIYQLSRLVKLQRRTRGIVQVGYNFRFSTPYQNVFELQRSFGEAIKLEISYRSNKPRSTFWKYGSVLESFMHGVAIHPIEMACDFLGQIEENSFNLTAPRPEYIDVQMFLKAGGKSVFISTSNTSSAFVMEIAATYAGGARATANSNLPKLLQVTEPESIKSGFSKLTKYEIELGASKHRDFLGYGEQMHRFSKLISNDVPNGLQLHDSIEPYRVIQDIVTSYVK